LDLFSQCTLDTSSTVAIFVPSAVSKRCPSFPSLLRLKAHDLVPKFFPRYSFFSLRKSVDRPLVFLIGPSGLRASIVKMRNLVLSHFCLNDYPLKPFVPRGCLSPSWFPSILFFSVSIRPLTPFSEPPTNAKGSRLSRFFCCPLFLQLPSPCFPPFAVYTIPSNVSSQTPTHSRPFHGPLQERKALTRPLRLFSCRHYSYPPSKSQFRFHFPLFLLLPNSFPSTK